LSIMTPQPTQPAPKTTDVHGPLVIRIVSSKKTYWLYTKYVKMPKD
jgi:hypothetical protein